MPSLARISIHPIKSFNPVMIQETAVLPSGALAHDREYALRDAEGKFVNAKRTAAIHRLHTSWDSALNTLCLQVEGSERAAQFTLPKNQAALERLLSGYFDQPITLDRNAEAGFPDDTNAPGPTIISTATLETVASWYPGMTLDECRRRFRANLEIDGVPAFWEDRLFGEAGEVVPFYIGDVLIEGVNPCQRCIVPTRDTQTAESTNEFAQIFRARREETLPGWANRSRFNHFYRLAINTCIPVSEAGKTLRLGDRVVPLR